ncbi:AraC family transcriptional regulator [Deinococcus pimensis]|uniref:AraC family transcriptional regulator n=1 Tax=Deinococcus pimensis TaxID=309888 RepID=UPI000A01CEF2|nr:AraC family transcriptional regulator [Deinococcus pimensis]
MTGPIVPHEQTRHSEVLADLIARHTSGPGLTSTIVPGLHLFRADAPSSPTHMLYRPSICLIAQGAKVTQQGETTLRYGPAEMLLVSVSLPLTVQILDASPDRPHLALHVDLDPALIATLALEFPDETERAAPPGSLAVTTLDPMVLDAATRLTRLLDTPQHVPALAPGVVRELTYLLLAGPEGARLRALVRTAGQTARIVAAIERLVHDYDRPVAMTTLAASVNMSVSGFHHHFKAVTAMSPLQYQKRLRLQEARRLLLGGASDVTGVSSRVGYDSPSQFSREYRRLFGVSPRQDRGGQRAKGSDSHDFGSREVRLTRMNDISDHVGGRPVGLALGLEGLG